MYSRNSDRANRDNLQLDRNSQERLDRAMEEHNERILGFSNTSFGQFSQPKGYDNGLEAGSPNTYRKKGTKQQDTSKLDDAFDYKTLDYSGL